MPFDGAIEGMQQDRQSVTRDWELTSQPLIDGVAVRAVTSVPTSYGYLCEIFRSDWGLDNTTVDQVFQGVLEPGAVTCWHAHAVTTDRLFVSYGMLRIVLYDARSGSSTVGMINQFRVGSVRPALLIVPPGVWHGVTNDSSGVGILVNVVDHAYHYEQPDHFRLPADSPKIPFDLQAERSSLRRHLPEGG